MDYSALWHVLRSRPLAALGALYWHVTGRKVRARNRLRINLAQSADAYQRWIEQIEHPGETVATTGRIPEAWCHRPLFSIIVHQPEAWEHGAFDRLIGMLEAQSYPHWELLVASPAPPPRMTALTRHLPLPASGENDNLAALKSRVMAARGAFVLPLPLNVLLPKPALFHYAEALQAAPQAIMLFGDEDRIDGQGGRHAPWFKSQWNAELALAQDYVSQALILSRSVALDALDTGLIGTAAPTYALALAVAWSAPDRVRHVAHVQAHVTDRGATTSLDTRVHAVRDHLNARGDSEAIVSADRHGIARVDWPLPSPEPSVSIIIPTRDKVALLKACLSSLLSSTAYQRFEVIVVDNGSRESSALAYLNEIDEHDSVRVLRDDRPYNYSQLNNMAVRHATGEYLCLLNNDTEIIEADWLNAMIRQAVRPDIGAVGARLLYDDGTIQHAGVAIGLGAAAGHVHRFQKREDFGYFARTHAAHFVSAVTAACLVVSKTKFEAVGGLDEQSLAIAFNDVDLCLKLQKAGWANLYTPYATLLHHESKSRGKDTSPKHIERFQRELAVLQQRWKTIDYLDPLHHPHLERSTENFLIRLKD